MMMSDHPRVLTVCLVSLLSSWSACKRSQPRDTPGTEAAAVPRLSPVPNQPPATTVRDPLAAWPDGPSEAGAIDAGIADAGVDGGVGAESAALAEPDAAPAKTDAQVAAEREARDLVATEQAVDRGLDRVNSELESCFVSQRVADGEARIQFNLRGGYVTAANVSGVATDVAGCLDRVLRQLKFSGLATHTATIERTFRFKR